MSGFPHTWLLLLSVMLAAAAYVHAQGTNLAGAPALSPAIRSAQLAIHAWDFGAMTNSATQLADAEARDAEAAFQRSYWRGVALLHAVFYARDGATDATVRAQEPALRQAALAEWKHTLTLRADTADGHAATAVLLGMTISDHWTWALRLGPQLRRHQKTAKQAGPNPRVDYLEGVARLRNAESPRELAAARDQLLRAVALFELEREKPVASEHEPRWGYDHALMFLAEACARLGETEAASRWNAKARAINPELRRARERKE